MPPTREQYDEQMKRMQAQVTRTRAVDLSLLHSAAVRAERLTGDEHWDAYLRQLQARLDLATKERETWSERMKTAWGEADMRIAQVNWHLWNSRVDTLNEIMELPKNVLETYRHEHDLATR